MPTVYARIPDSLRISGYIEEPISKSAKSRLMEILSRTDLQSPLKAVPEVSVQAYFWLNNADIERLQVLGQKHELSPSDVVTALLVDDFKHQEREVETAQAAPQSQATQLAQGLESLLSSMQLSMRPEQAKFYACINQVIQIEDPALLPKVMFAESGTGTGKTMAYLCAAHDFLLAHRTSQAAVAVPSHALMTQVLAEWRRVQAAAGTEIATVSIIGQAEFVSSQALAEILPDLTDAAEREAIQAWIDRGAPAGNDSLIQSRWTMAALRQVAPAFSFLEHVSLLQRDDDDDDGWHSYRQQWAHITHASMLFMSHAMIASLTMRRLTAQARAMKSEQTVVDTKAGYEAGKSARRRTASEAERKAEWKAKKLADKAILDAGGTLPSVEREKRLHEALNEIYAAGDADDGLDLLPNLDLLIVDEAHALEDAFSMVLSQVISVYALKTQLTLLREQYPRSITKSMVDGMDALWDRFRNTGQASPDARLALSEDEKACMVELRDILAGVLQVKGGASKQKGAAFRKVYQIARSVDLAVSTSEYHDSAIGVAIDWSPDRKWPRVSVGRTSVAREMDYLWRVVCKRVVLVSGTLYEEIPQLSCETARRSLNVPHAMAMTMEPVHAPWAYRAVTVCMVANTHAPDGRERFVRPRPQDHSAEEFARLHLEWANDVAHYLLKAHSVAEGGMLVLGTAYQDVALVANLLRSNGLHVLESSKGVPLANLRKEFMDVSAASGVRPVLLAVAGAWTGFDLHSKENPNLLTDLAILNVPFGAISRSIAREARVRRVNGVHEIVAQVVILVRQACGRIVRSPDTPHNRRIHWLDARIHRRSMAGLLNPVIRVFARYKQIPV